MPAKARNRFRVIGSYTGTWDPGATTTVDTTTVDVPGAKTTDAVVVTVQAPTTGIVFCGLVTAPSVVTLRAQNVTAGSLNAASTTVTVLVLRP